MNILVFIGVIAALIAFRFLKPNAFAWTAALWVGIWVALRFGVDPPMPSSILSLFMAIVTLALVTYLTITEERMRQVGGAIVTFFTDRRFTIALIAALILVPSLVAFQVYRSRTGAPQPPISGRTIHPVPPNSINFKGTTIDLQAVDNPYRELEQSDADAFEAHVENGRRVYYENCVFCHGDNMEGDGIFAHGLDPIPANFQDATTIAMLQEGYLFWRISKGGPGLPAESTPWLSAMPAWELFLTEEEIWDVILFLYDYTGHRPRAREEAH